MKIREIDFISYIRPPRLSSSTGMILTIQTIRAAPKNLPNHVHAGLLGIRDRGEQVQGILRERERMRSHDLRPFDRSFDANWGAFHMRVLAHTRGDGPKAGRAAELLAAYFPDGLRFLTASYEEQWLYSRTLLGRFEAEGVEAEIDALAGGDFLDRVKKSHDALGEAVGLGETDPEEVPQLGPALNELAAAHANYARLFAGIVELDDPESVARFQAAMAPRDAHNAAARRRRGLEVEESELPSEEEQTFDVDEPLPPVPPSEG